MIYKFTPRVRGSVPCAYLRVSVISDESRKHESKFIYTHYHSVESTTSTATVQSRHRFQNIQDDGDIKKIGAQRTLNYLNYSFTVEAGVFVLYL